MRYQNLQTRFQTSATNCRLALRTGDVVWADSQARTFAHLHIENAFAICEALFADLIEHYNKENDELGIYGDPTAHAYEDLRQAVVAWRGKYHGHA